MPKTQPYGFNVDTWFRENSVYSESKMKGFSHINWYIYRRSLIAFYLHHVGLNSWFDGPGETAFAWFLLGIWHIVTSISAYVQPALHVNFTVQLITVALIKLLWTNTSFSNLINAMFVNPFYTEPSSFSPWAMVNALISKPRSLYTCFCDFTSTSTNRSSSLFVSNSTTFTSPMEIKNRLIYHHQMGPRNSFHYRVYWEDLLPIVFAFLWDTSFNVY